MIEINIGALVVLLGIPTATTGFCFWMLEHRIQKREATARAVQRIPDAHCNGDMHAALDYAAKIKHAQKDFLTSQGIHAIID